MKIKLIPNILSPKGRKEYATKWSPKKTVAQYLKEKKISSRGMRVIVSGKALKKLSVPVKRMDEIIVTPSVKDPFTIGLATMAIVGISSMGVPTAAFALTATIVGWAVIGAVVGIAALAIVSVFSAPRRPSFGSVSAAGGGIDASSPTYGWDGVQTTQNVGTPVPIVYGEHKVGGNIINQFIENDGDKNYLSTLLALCEGEVESISDIQINDNPIANFDGIETSQKLGTNDQEPLLGYELLHGISTVAVNLNDMDDAHTFTTFGNDVLGFEVLITFPAGLYYMANSGGVSEGLVRIRIDYKLHTDAEWTELDTYDIRSSNRSAARRIFRKLGIEPGQYDIRVTRLTAVGDTNNIRDMSWTHCDELRDDSLSYPNTALLGLTYLATDQLSGGTPNVTCIVKGKKILTPNVLTEEGGDLVPWDDYYYDPATEKYRLFADDSELHWGGDYVTAYSANPVWCIYDLLINNRYGVGEFIDTTHLNLESFLEMSQYSDGKVALADGSYEKRFRLDCVIDSDSKAIDALIQLANSFRAIFFFSENAIKLKVDKPELSVQMFTMGNIVADSFMQKWRSIKDVPNEMQVQFLDRDKNYEQEVISYIDESALTAGAVLRKKEIRLFTTRITQAIREARYLINSSKYVDRSISFKAGIDSLACQVGDVIDFAHDVPQWGYSGRILSAFDASTVVLDRTVPVAEGTVFKLRIRHSDDTVEERTVANIPGTTANLTVAEPFSFTPEAYDVFSFGAVNEVVKPFRIMAISREPNNEAQITAVEYNASIYDDSAPAVPTSNYSSLQKQVSNVTGLLLTESAIKAPDGTVVSVLDAWFNRPDDAAVATEFRFDKAKIYVSNNEQASWRYVGETYGEHFQVQNVLVGQKYHIAVVSVSALGMQNPVRYSTISSLTITGKTEPPEDVSSFLCYQRRDNLIFGWTEVADLDIYGYEIRRGASWESGFVVATGIVGDRYETATVNIESGQSFWIKAIDTNGNYSLAAKEATISVEAVPFQNIIMQFAEENDSSLTFQSFGDAGFDDVGDNRFSDTAWCGTRENMELDGANLAFAADQISGKYTTRIRDIGYVAPFRIMFSPLFTLAGDDTWASFGDDTFQTNPTLRFSGQETSVAVAVRIRTSEDNITWTDWTEWRDADFKCRYFQLEFTFTRASLDQDAQCSSLKYIADLPDVDEFGADAVTVAADGAAVVFSKTFHQAPIVAISILAGDGKVSSFTVAPTITGFTVKLYDFAGNAVTGQFAFHAHGI